MGLAVIDDVVHVVQRGEVSRLLDADKDGTADVIETVNDDWGVSGNYHEYAFGLPRDDSGHLYVSLNVAFTSPKWWLGSSSVPYRGWVLQIDENGKSVPFACGFRSPCGIGRNTKGDVFVTDNQGDWMPACPLFHVEEGKFYGHPAGLRWRKDFLEKDIIPSQTNPPHAKRTMPAVWLPYKWARSAGEMICDETNGNFGPFPGQMFVAELTNGNILRVQLEKIQGQYQGAVFMFRKQVGSAVRLAFAEDHSLIIGRTNRGWGGLNPGDGLASLTFNGKTPFEVATVHLEDDGFLLKFTQAIQKPAGDYQITPQIIEYDYNYWWEYGSPEVHKKPVEVESVQRSADGLQLKINALRLRPGKVVQVNLGEIKSVSKTPLRHGEFHYTINQLPSGHMVSDVVAKVVPPPAAKESPYEGWVYLNKINGGDRWDGEGWTAVKHTESELTLDSNDPSKIKVIESKKPDNKGADGQSSPISLLCQDPGKPHDLTCKISHGAIETWFDVFLPQGGSASVFFQGRYELLFADDEEEMGLQFGIVPNSTGKNGKKNSIDIYRGPGSWHVVNMKFHPPRFDETNKKFLSASFEDVTIDGTLLHESVELPACSPNAPNQEESGAQGGIVLRCNSKQAAFRRFSMRVLGAPADDENWEPIFNGTDIDDWRRSDKAKWRVENQTIIGSGETGHLFSPRDDYRNFEVKARVKINDQGNSGLYFRTTFGPGWPQGYEAQVNSTYHDPVKSGSLYNLDVIKAMFVEPGVWFDYYVRCVDTDKGVHIVIKLNNFVVVDFLDKKRINKSGHIALQQHHPGSEVQFRNIMIRELN